MAEALVAIKGVTKRYGTKTAIGDLSLNLEAGETLALLGANGGGKTTSLRILAGLLEPDAGDGSVLGIRLRHGSREIRRQVGYLAQGFSLYADLTVAENLEFRAEIYDLAQPRQIIDAVLEDYSLTAFRRTRADALSGGWARRLQLAAALLHHPRLVLLDEPTLGLDMTARQDMWRRIARLARDGVGFIISTHDLADAERCGRAMLLIAGKIVARGSPAALAAALPARCYLLTGSGLDSERIEGMPGVIACQPGAEDVRVLAEDGAEAALRRLAAGAGWSLTAVPPRLEDAVLAHTGRAAS